MMVFKRYIGKRYPQGLNVKPDIKALLEWDMRIRTNESFIKKKVLIAWADTSCKNAYAISPAEVIPANSIIMKELKVGVLAVLGPFLNIQQNTVFPSNYCGKITTPSAFSRKSSATRTVTDSLYFSLGSCVCCALWMVFFLFFLRFL
jgi:hypothetical protein